MKVCENYCALSRYLYRRGSQSDYSQFISGKEISLQFLLNWISTTSPQLKPLRDKATDALVTLTKSGPILSESRC